MDLFSISDLPFLLIFPTDWWNLVVRLSSFQKSVRSPDWPSLSDLYPRTAIWVYAYSLFSWGELTNQLDLLLKTPNKSAIAEIFLRYICQIDNYVDSFPSKEIWKRDPYKIAKLPQVKLVSDMLYREIKEQDLSIQISNLIENLIGEYCELALGAMQYWISSPETLENALQIKSNTAGTLWYYWSKILCGLYNVPQDLSNDVSLVFFNYGMLVQVIDDLADTPIDYKMDTLNLFIAVVKNIPDEWARLQRHLVSSEKAFLGWPWVRKHLPISYKIIDDLYKSFSQKLLFYSPKPNKSKKILYAMECIRRMSTYR